MLGCLDMSGVPIDGMVSVYAGCVRPICEYAAPVWHSNIIQNHAYPLEHIQKRACRNILDPNYDSYVDACNLLGSNLWKTEDYFCSHFGNKTIESNRYTQIGFPPVLVPQYDS